MLTILVAHHAEGKPFLTHYDMKPDKADKRRFIGDRVCLRIVGQGGENARRSLVEELSINVVSEERRWLNFGVAGSSEYAVSDVVEVTALNVGEPDGYAPEYLLERRTDIPASCCRSFAMPQDSYPAAGVVDMEAYFIAAVLSPRSLLANFQVIKLVVDDPSTRPGDLTRAILRRHLITAQSTLTEISDRLIIS